MIANNLINGTYYWGFIAEFQNALGTIVKISSSPNSFWTAIPSRYPDIEIGIPVSQVNDIFIAQNFATVQLPGKVEYNFLEF